MVCVLYIACSATDLCIAKVTSALDTPHTWDDSPSEAHHDHENLYTPAMLAEILGVSVRIVRRWHRAGLLSAVKEVLQLPYFGFAELAAARRLAKWMQQGASVHSIQLQLEQLRARAMRSGMDIDFSPADLPIAAEGKRLVLRAGDTFLEANGQFRFGFEAESSADSGESGPATLSFHSHQQRSVHPPGQQAFTAGAGKSCDYSFEEMMEQALAAEDEEQFEPAIDWYRAALSAFGPSADICFQLAELLYRTGDSTAARERYFMALELNPDLVEARANLGCVLAECGQLDLAVAAFEGTLEQFDGYADVHFHLARALDDLGHPTRACEHWNRFLELAPASPWAEEAVQRLATNSPLLEYD